jgi:hypothetical protein
LSALKDSRNIENIGISNTGITSGAFPEIVAVLLNANALKNFDFSIFEL